MTVSAFSFSTNSAAPAVIACVDEGPESKAIAEAAAHWARWLNRPLVFFHSMEFESSHSHLPDPLEWHLRRGKIRQKLQAISADLGTASPAPSFEIHEGEWLSALSDRAMRSPDAIIVIGTSLHGDTGHLVSQLLESGVNRLLIVPKGYKPSQSESPQIAIPLDGSKFSESALAQAIAMARNSPAELLLMHVMPKAGIDAFGPLASSDLELQMLVDQRNEEAACSFLESILRRLRDMGITARSRCLRGDPRVCLESVLAEEEAELVVLSARGQGLASCESLALGSTADYLLDHLDAPVMMVGSGPSGRAEKSPRHHDDQCARNIRGPLNSSPVAA